MGFTKFNRSCVSEENSRQHKAEKAFCFVVEVFFASEKNGSSYQRLENGGAADIHRSD